MGRFIPVEVIIAGNNPYGHYFLRPQLLFALDTYATRTLIDFRFAVNYFNRWVDPSTGLDHALADSASGIPVKAYTFECAYMAWEGLIKENFAVSAIPEMSRKFDEMGVIGLLGTDLLLEPDQQETEEVIVGFPTMRIERL